MKNKRYKLTQLEKRQEKEADYFARCILMPEDMILKQLEKYKNKLPKQDLINKFGEIFQVEPMHVVLRFDDLDILIT